MERVSFTTTDAVTLEGEVDVPPGADTGLVICHAHPGMQGTMRSPLLLALRDEVVARGIAVLRFNFRGVGGSEGEFGTGIAEVADAAAAAGFLRERVGAVAICGWSFGGAVAIRLTADDPKIACCAAIAPAVEEKPGATAGLPPPSELSVRVPLLVIVGSNDKHTPPSACRPWAEAAGARYVEIKAANHFFWAKYEPVVEAVAGFVEGTLS
ncbi:MAG TPA: alpha/beta fold hydrolase [Actinomycetota bacterium]|jgi:uncharacterized protein|nr:alpha/beta fold hydrolase [Actinomycetota bacterium]